jgi:hypothetical protein
MRGLATSRATAASAALTKQAKIFYRQKFQQ